MKKQLIAATIVASISTISVADISISGSSKVNAKGGIYTHEADMSIVGKSGATSVVANIGADMGAFTTEQLYTKTSIAGVNIKAGNWKSGKGELGTAGGNTTSRVNVSSSMNGITLSYEDKDNSAGATTTISGAFQGIKLSHKFKEDDKSETSASAKMGGLAASFHYKNQANDNADTSVTLKGAVQGMNLTYVKTSSDTGTSMDGFIGKVTDGSVTSASAIGVSTSIGGNKFTFKNTDINGTTNQKLIMTRKLTSGSTFEATYDKNADSLDLEFGVKF